jgi:CheY-like chemotaxis protein
MDLQMPVKDGFVAAADIREIESKRILARPDPSQGRSRMKIYALSGLASPEDKERASTIGFDG